MAKKMETEQPDPHADDLVILHPEQTLKIAGRQVTMREYGFVEGLKIRPLSQPFIVDLDQQMAESNGNLPLDAIVDLVAAHMDAVLDMIAVAADLDRAFIEELDDPDGQALLMAWWSVNGPFFMRALQTRVINRVLDAQRPANPKTAPAGPTSTPPSSPPDTPPNVSDSTPSVS